VVNSISFDWNTYPREVTIVYMEITYKNNNVKGECYSMNGFSILLTVIKVSPWANGNGIFD